MAKFRYPNLLLMHGPHFTSTPSFPRTFMGLPFVIMAARRLGLAQRRKGVASAVWHANLQQWMCAADPEKQYLLLGYDM